MTEQKNDAEVTEQKAEDATAAEPAAAGDAGANEEESIDEAWAAERLTAIAEKMRRADVLAHRRKEAQWVGTILILLLLGIFVYRLFAHFHDYATAFQDTERREQILQEFLEESDAQRIVLSELQSLTMQLEEELLPKLFDDIVLCLQEAQAELHDEAGAMGERLVEHTKKGLSEALAQALKKSFDSMEGELRTALKDMPEAEFTQNFEQAKAAFVEKLPDIIETGLARVQASLDVLQDSVRKCGERFEPSSPQVSRGTAAEGEFIEALVDLIVYELKPELGAEPVAAASDEEDR